MKPKISLITLGVSDIKRSLAFYRDGLGFKPYKYKDGEDHVMFEMEGSWLGLFPKEKLAEGANVPVAPNGCSGIVFAHNVATKEEVDTVFRLTIRLLI